MSTSDKNVARRMIEFIDASPSPYHACESAARMLERAGFSRLEEVDAWDATPGAFYVIRGGSLVAWALQDHHRAWSGFRILGAHTDSPNLRVKPHPDRERSGCLQLGVEVYGGVLLNSWLDRDLGLSGRVHVRGERGPEQRLFLADRPLLKIPQLAIHLHREINTDGLKLNKQAHMSPLWNTLDGDERGFVTWLAEELDVQPDDILAWDAMVHDTNPSSLFGQDEQFVSAPRLDNLCSSFCALSALVEQVERGTQLEYIPVVSLFDHEEVGSGSAAGAESPMLRDLLERTVLARGGTREEYHRAIADSASVSIDMAHATHPNYAEMHDPDHSLFMNEGPVIKVNSNMRYASESETVAMFALACEAADVPYQRWVMRSDLACGSTIGPITAQNLGIRTVDVGNPQLGMHSVRETCGSADPDYMVRALGEILR
jgi:aspartyl aminopeptidase